MWNITGMMDSDIKTEHIEASEELLRKNSHHIIAR